MFLAGLLVLGCAAVGAISGPAAVQHDDDVWTLALLKRQAPGTPAYACHSSCGTAITASRGSSPCTDSVFLTDYAACLACAGPANLDIWKYYGGTLSTAGTKCGLSTTPASGSTESTAAVTSAAQAVTTSALPAAATTVAATPVTTSAAAAASSSESVTASVISGAASSTSAPTASSGIATATVAPFTGAAVLHVPQMVVLSAAVWFAGLLVM